MGTRISLTRISCSTHGFMAAGEKIQRTIEPSIVPVICFEHVYSCANKIETERTCVRIEIETRRERNV